jgi:hypothetical protein
MTRQTGTVAKWLNHKGIGFITPEGETEGENDVLVHFQKVSGDTCRRDGVFLSVSRWSGMLGFRIRKASLLQRLRVPCGTHRNSTLLSRGINLVSESSRPLVFEAISATFQFRINIFY